MNNQNSFTENRPHLDHEVVDLYVRHGRHLHSQAIREAFASLSISVKTLFSPTAVNDRHQHSA